MALKTYKYGDIRGPDLLVRKAGSKIWHDHCGALGTGCGVIIERREAVLCRKGDFVSNMRRLELGDERECQRCFE